MLLQTLTSERFKEAILKVVKLNERFIPPYETGASLYIRPLLIGTRNYPTANSQITSGVDGMIVPLETMACAKGIVDFIRNKELQSRLIILSFVRECHSPSQGLHHNNL